MYNKFYEQLKSQSKVIAFAVFIILFGFYSYPIIKEAKYKNSCIKFSSKGALTKFNNDSIREKLLEETGLTIEELSKIEGYKNCLK